MEHVYASSATMAHAPGPEREDYKTRKMSSEFGIWSSATVMPLQQWSSPLITSCGHKIKLWKIYFI